MSLPQLVKQFPIEISTLMSITSLYEIRLDSDEDEVAERVDIISALNPSLTPLL